jgi:hypothetical protein
MKILYIFLIILISFGALGCKSTPIQNPDPVKPKEGEIFLPPVQYSILNLENSFISHI